MYVSPNRLKQLSLAAIISSFILSIILIGPSAEAAKVTQVGKGQALISIESGDSPNVGDLYFVMVNGKKKALVQVTQVKGKRAKVIVKKGTPQVGAELSLARAGGGGSGKSASSGRRGRKGALDGVYIGGMLGFNKASQSVKTSSGDSTISMAGSGFSAKAFADVNITGGLGALLRFGVEQLNLSGSTTTTNYSTKIMYLSGDLLLRYRFLSGAWQPYIAGGMGLHFPITKSSNALQDIPTMTVFFGDLGVNYNLSRTSYVTVLGEYGLFPASSDVTTSFIAGRVGYGIRF